LPSFISFEKLFVWFKDTPKHRSKNVEKRNFCEERSGGVAAIEQQPQGENET
jgi:hypothetical protein